MANTPFKLKSGNSPLYKNLGSSPAKFTTAIGRWLRGRKKAVSDRGTEYIYDKDTRKIVKEKVDGKWTSDKYMANFGGGKNIGLHYLDVDRYDKQMEGGADPGLTNFLRGGK
jgi:hypothetical protein